MCLYQTYHWSCCPGTSRPAPYFMNSICPEATGRKYIGGMRKRCKIQFTVIDGADYGETCPACLKAPNLNEDYTVNDDDDDDDDGEDTNDTQNQDGGNQR